MLTKRRYCFDYVRRRVKGIGRENGVVWGGGGDMVSPSTGIMFRR